MLVSVPAPSHARYETVFEVEPTSLCWNSLVTPKNNVVASCVENVSPVYRRYTILVSRALHFRGDMGDSLNTLASWITVVLSLRNAAHGYQLALAVS